MKRMITSGVILLFLICALTSCSKAGKKIDSETYKETQKDENEDNITIEVTDLGDDLKIFGTELEELGVYDGYFEENIVNVTVNCVSGTEGCYSIDGNTLKFSGLNENSVYSISGQLAGNIVIDIGDEYKLDLEMQNFSMVSDLENPVEVVSGKKVSITAKVDTKNYIYDMRDAVDEEDESAFLGTIHSDVDLEICGKGSMVVYSQNNNGIHSKNDLQVKNLDLLVVSNDNALKGNDSVCMEEGTTTLIATQGDGIKTTNSDISEKGNQRGNVSVLGGIHTIYAACDGIDAAYNVLVDSDTTVLNIYTDKYSSYSSEVTAVDEEQYYIRFSSNNYKYSVKYYNSEEDYCWVNAEYYSSISGHRNNYYYYSFPKMTDKYEKLQIFIYDSNLSQGQEDEYLAATEYLSLSSGYDTFAIENRGNTLSYQWTNYTTSIQENGRGGMGGPGGMNDGNTDKGEYSTKGIKADNEIVINAGSINIKSYDDAIHADNDTTLENSEDAVGNVKISGGVITVYSKDDGIHADGTLTICGGTINVTNSYEGLEGTNVVISGGNVSVCATDDGINGVATSGTAVDISGGNIYVNCTGDGIDSNSRTSYEGIVFSGGNVVIIANSSNNSAIDTEQGYKYIDGLVVAIMPSRGMTNEVMHCSNFTSVATKSILDLKSGNYLMVKVGENIAVTVEMQDSISAMVIYLGDSNANILSESSTVLNLDSNGVAWNK